MPMMPQQSVSRRQKFLPINTSRQCRQTRRQTNRETDRQSYTTHQANVQARTFHLHYGHYHHCNDDNVVVIFIVGEVV